MYKPTSANNKKSQIQTIHFLLRTNGKAKRAYFCLFALFSFFPATTSSPSRQGYPSFFSFLFSPIFQPFNIPIILQL